MPITVPVTGDQISATSFGAPVANALNQLSAIGAPPKIYLAALSSIPITQANTWHRFASVTISIAPEDIKPNLIALLWGNIYLAASPAVSFALSMGWDNARFANGGTSGQAGPYQEGPNLFGWTPTISVAGSHTMEIWGHFSVTCTAASPMLAAMLFTKAN